MLAGTWQTFGLENSRKNNKKKFWRVAFYSTCYFFMVLGVQMLDQLTHVMCFSMWIKNNVFCIFTLYPVSSHVARGGGGQLNATVTLSTQNYILYRKILRTSQPLIQHLVVLCASYWFFQDGPDALSVSSYVHLWRVTWYSHKSTVPMTPPLPPPLN